MRSAVRCFTPPPPRADLRPSGFGCVWRTANVAWRSCWLLLLALGLSLANAADLELTNFEVARSEEGLLVDYAVNLELSRSVDDALSKAVPLFFVAEASLFRSRWYWRDRRVAHAVRIWRIVYQPLTATYRVSFGGLSQNYPTRSEALAAIGRGVRWRVAEPGQIEEGSRQYLEFSYRLDTSQLPRPMQIGIDGQPDWTLSVERTQRLN